MWAIKAVEGQPRVVEAPRPSPGPGELLIKVVAAGVNRADLLQVVGHYAPPPGAPDTLGLEAAGVVVEVGPSPERLNTVAWLGQSVVALVGGGAQAEYCVARAEHCIPLPQAWRLDDCVAGAALLEAAATAWYNLVTLETRMTREEQPGRESIYSPGFTALIHGGSGGVGTVALQLAKELGALVAATAGTAERRQKLSLLGADAVADYRDLKDLVRARDELTGGRGFDLILDVSGAGGLERNLDLLAWGGRLQIIGLQKGVRGELDLSKLLGKSALVQGSTIRALPDKKKMELLLELRYRVWPLVAAGRLRPVIAATYPFTGVAQAHAQLSSRKREGELQRPFGKLVLIAD